ncbi:MAG TPA: hypothetical protein VME20_05030 [Acidimicrobiales bacterium]|nr:hypothetical protein [Acidimicrobiales bacterium]
MTRRIYIGALIVALLVGVVWYETLYHSERAHIRSLQAQEQTATNSLALLQAHYVSLVASEKRLPAERVALADLRQLVPDGPELDDLVTSLFGIAARSGVILQSISSPQPEAFVAAAAAAASGTSSGASTSSGPAELQLSLGVEGTPAQITQLYKLLDAAPRLFVIDNFAIPVANATGATANKGAGRKQPSIGAVAVTVDLRAFYALSTADNAASN